MRILLILFISALIIAFIVSIRIKRNDDRRYEQLYSFLFKEKNALREAIIGSVSEDNLSEQLDNLISYDVFKESCIRSIKSEIKKRIDLGGFDWINIPDNLKYNATTDYVLSALDSILDSDEVDKLLAKLFVNKVADNIKEAEKIEEEAIKYHESFGKEPDGDPILHSKEYENDYYEEQQEYKELEDLLDSGTIEDIPQED